MIALGFIIAIGLPLAVLILSMTLPAPTSGASIGNEIFRVEPRQLDITDRKSVVSVEVEPRHHSAAQRPDARMRDRSEMPVEGKEP